MTTPNLLNEYLLAAELGNLNQLKTCLTQGIEINASNRQGQTAITLASLNHH
ncbi:TPA: ankyrin repeat domain-containing protein, partial [Klebsiella michiganensis]|nr:ankyrin repeat domain-containing protein [Klebsiella michiganensis]